MAIEFDNPHAHHAQSRVSIVAGQQHGLITRAQLAAIGLGRGAVRHRLGTGALHRVRPGVYAVGHAALRPQARLLASVLACGPGAVLSHASAAMLWGIRPSSAALADVTAPGRRRPPPGVRMHHAPLPPDQVTVIDGIPVTTIERTIVDLAAVARREAVRYALEQAEHLGLPDWRVLDELVEAGKGRRGIVGLRALLAERDHGARITKSDLERAFLAFLRREGLPLPETNAVVEGFEVDCVWRAARLVVELDSRLHLGFGKFERDRRRDRRLTTAGWRPIRVTSEQIHGEPAALRADLARLLRTA